MKTSKTLAAVLLISAIMAACSNNNKAASSAADTAKNKKQADTAIVPAGQKSVKNDSLSGDPSSKGSSDPDAKLPKK